MPRAHHRKAWAGLPTSQQTRAANR